VAELENELRGRALLRIAPLMALRTLIFAGLIFAAVSIQPREPVDTISIIIVVCVVLFIWGALFGLVFWWQIRRISKARHPQAQMVEALATVFVLFLAIFAKTYHIISQAYPHSFSEDLDYFSSLYFALTVLSTVGFGDISPIMPLARGVTMLQMVLDIVLIGVAVRVITTTASKAIGRKRAKVSTAAAAPSSDSKADASQADS